MITVMKIAVLLFCAAAAVGISLRSVQKQLTCHLLSFFVAAGVMTFFSEDAVGLSFVAAFAVFAVLFILTTLLSHKTAHRKNDEGKQKTA